MERTNPCPTACLLTAIEVEAGCGTVAVWTSSYDLMGNLTEKVRYEVAKMLLEET